MTRLKHLVLLFSVLITISSCGILGVHFKVRNPGNAGKYPEFDKETILVGQLTPVRQNFDVVFYGLDIQISPSEKKVGGWVEIKAIALTEIDSIQLNLDQPLAIEELRWKTREGESLRYSRQYRTVMVNLNQKVKQNQSFSIHVKYSGIPVESKKPPWSGGLVWKKDKQKNPWIGVVCETEGASIWFPCKDHVSDKPDSAYLRFTIPDMGLSVVSNGVFVGTEKKNNFQSFTWKVSYPISAYNITFYVGNFGKIEDSYIGINSKELKLSYYVLKPNLEKAALHFRQVSDDIRAYEELYGEYPFYKDGFKLVESPFEGMEHQTAIAYGSGFKNDLYRKDDYVILHETGHEWFGNAVTVDDLAGVWLHEGITTYGEALYMEKKYNPAEALNHLIFYRWLIKNKLPVEGPAGRHYFDTRDGDVYVKGAWILHSLRNNINNDSVFFAILRTFYNENRMEVTNSKTFIETVNRITGKDYNWFFNQYLYQNKVPVFEYKYLKGGTIYYRWTNVAEGFNKLCVPVKFKDDAAIFELYPDYKVQKFILPDGQNLDSRLLIDNNKALFGIKKNQKLPDLFIRQNDKR